jgi:hypothetical protein
MALIYAIVGIVATLLIVGVILSSLENKSPEMKEKKEAHLGALRKQLDSYKIEKTILVKEYFSNNYNVAISTITRNIIIYQESDNPYIPHKLQVISFDRIVGSEFVENGEVVKKGWLGRSIVGGTIAGGAGAVIGAMTRGSNSTVSSLNLKIITDDAINPLYELPFITIQTDRNSSTYERMYKIAEELYATIVSIEKTKSPSESKIDTVTELKRYKELLDEGIITQEEFEEKKKALLNKD